MFSTVLIKFILLYFIVGNAFEKKKLRKLNYVENIYLLTLCIALKQAQTFLYSCFLCISISVNGIHITIPILIM